MEVEVIRSSKRRKSVSARVVDGRIVVRMPQWMTKAQEAEYVESMVAKLVRQHTAKTVDLTARAGELARRYRPAGAPVDPLREQPGQPVGILLTRHRRDPHQRSHRRRSPTGCSTRWSSTSSPTWWRPTTAPRSTSWPTATRSRSAPRLPARHGAHRGRRRGLRRRLIVEPGEPLVHALVDLLERPLHREQLPLDLLQRREVRRRARVPCRTLGGRWRLELATSSPRLPAAPREPMDEHLFRVDAVKRCCTCNSSSRLPTSTAVARLGRSPASARCNRRTTTPRTAHGADPRSSSVPQARTQRGSVLGALRLG